MQHWYCISELSRLLSRGDYRKKIHEYGDEPPGVAVDQTFESLKAGITKYIQSTRRVELANKRLIERGLIKGTPHQNDAKVVGISLTLASFDLGCKYCGWFQRSGLCFSEYRNHWIWLIVAFLGGGIAIKAIESLFKLLTK